MFDVNFRTGNRDKHGVHRAGERLQRPGFMAEGPLSRKNGSSYLVSYRYGIASVAATGTSAIPITTRTSPSGPVPYQLRFELFGTGGTSSHRLPGQQRSTENDLFADPGQRRLFTNTIGLGGGEHFRSWTTRT